MLRDSKRGKGSDISTLNTTGRQSFIGVNLSSLKERKLCLYPGRESAVKVPQQIVVVAREGCDEIQGLSTILATFTFSEIGCHCGILSRTVRGSDLRFSHNTPAY